MKTTKILSASSFILLVCILAVASLYLLSPSARKVITEKGAYFSSFSEKLAFLGKGKELRRIDGVLDIQEIRSSEGIHAWLVQDESVPVISMHFAFSDAGSARDPLDKQGLARLVSNTMDEGAGNLNAEQFQAALRDDAIELSFFSSRDYYGGSLYTLSDNKNKAFKLLKMALTQPHYKEEALVRMRAANIARIRHSLSSPEWRMSRIAYDKAFEGHPYAKNSGGTISGLKNIRPRDLKRFSDTYLTRENLVIGIAGDITPEDAGKMIDHVFGKLPEEIAAPPISDVNVRNLSLNIHHEMDIPQTHITLWQPGIDRLAEDYIAATILNAVLGGSGFGSRLTERAREDEGLTYTIHSSYRHFLHANPFVVTTSTESKNTQRMLEIIRSEITHLREEGVRREELKAIKSYMVGSLPLRFTSNPAISSALMDLQAERLPIDYLDQYLLEIEAVTPEKINAAARRLLNPESFLTITVGSQKKMSGEKKRYQADIILKTLPNAE